MVACARSIVTIVSCAQRMEHPLTRETMIRPNRSTILEEYVLIPITIRPGDLNSIINVQEV